MNAMPTPTPFARALLDWYDAHKRDLPWRRRAADPYAVWVSEIMLQQTTVAAVVPFYERWMARFPDLQTLAAAPLDDALKLWAGLGYYARARNLHKGAQTVMQMHGGRVPSDPKELRALPGIGRYTAGAILSIAFGQDAPILDANVVRVLSRIHAVPGDPKTNKATQDQLWTLAERDIPSGNAGDFNQALMELGALVCVPAAPRCHVCPVQSHCLATKNGDPTAFPQFQTVKKWLDVEHVSVAVRNARAEVLIIQRPATETLWGGLWELPRVSVEQGETLCSAAQRAARETVGMESDRLVPFGVVKHVVANRRITLHGFVANGAGEPRCLNCARFAWEPLAALENYALATPQVKLMEQLKTHDAQGRLELT